MKKLLVLLAITASQPAFAQGIEQYNSPFETNNIYNRDGHSYNGNTQTYQGYNRQDTTNNSYDSNDFSGLGMNRGQGARAADRANSINERPLSSDDFSGMGLSPAEGRRAADRANRNRY
jgi:hypothetical protein